VIFHITSVGQWAAAEASGQYAAGSLATEGFIHCSTESQVARVANTAFRGQPDLVVLHIDEALLAAPVKYENTEGGDELFPHVYGPIGASAVTKVTPLQPGVDGLFALP
jgi:uncharacterized protein (DUF952 family)